MLGTPLPDDGSNPSQHPSVAPSPAHSAARVATPGSLGEKQGSNEAVGAERTSRAARASRSLSFGDRQRRPSRDCSSSGSGCGTSVGVGGAGSHGQRTPTSDPDEADLLSSPCSAGGARRSSPTRMTLWDLRARMQTAAPSDEAYGGGGGLAQGASAGVMGGSSADPPAQAVGGVRMHAQLLGGAEPPEPRAPRVPVTGELGQVSTESPL